MPTASTVTVAAGTVLNTLTNVTYSANVALYDDQFAGTSGNPLMPDSPAKYKASGMTAIRFPGGTPSDNYHPFGLTYKTGAGAYNPTPDPTQWCGTPNSAYIGDVNSVHGNGISDFDDFMRNIVVPQNLNVIYTHNYGTNVHDIWGPNNHYGNASGGGDPVEAACVANYINSNGWANRVVWHEVGNECYGGWEPDSHSAPHDPTTYANAYLQYRSAIKAINANFKVVAVLLCPTPDYNDSWNRTVLSIIGNQMDGCCIHLYPIQNGHEVDSQILSAAYLPSGTSALESFSPAKTINGGVENGKTAVGVRQLLQQYCGSNPIGYQNIPILVTETNITPQYSTPATTGPVGALFLADYYHTWIDQGATCVTWHDYHNGANGGGLPSFQAYAWGDYGLISSNQGYTQTTTSGNAYGKPSIADGWIYPKYYAMQMLTSMGKTGDSVVSTSSSQAVVRSHAVRQAGGALSLVLVNTDPTNSYTPTVSYTGFTGSTAASVRRFDSTYCPITSPPTPVTPPSAPATLTATSTGFTDTIAPYSINVYTINPSGTPVSGQTITTSGTAVAYPSGTTAATPGSTVTFSTTVTGSANGGPYGLQFLVNDPTGALQTGLPQMSTGTLSANTPVPLSLSYTIPSAGAVGTWTVRAQVTSADYTTTIYTTDATPVSVTVQAASSGGGPGPRTAPSAVSAVPLPTIPDSSTPDHLLHQAVALLQPTDPAHPLYNAKSPMLTGVDLSTLGPTTLATDAKLNTIIALLSGTGAMTASQEVQWFYSDYSLTDTTHTLAARKSSDPVTDTGPLATGGVGFLVLQVALGPQTATSGTPRVEFWLERQLKNGGWDTTALYHNGPIPGTTPNQTVFQIVTTSFSGPNVTLAALTDVTRLRWQVSSDAGSSVAATSKFSIQIWGR